MYTEICRLCSIYTSDSANSTLGTDHFCKFSTVADYDLKRRNIKNHAIKMFVLPTVLKRIQDALVKLHRTHISLQSLLKNMQMQQVPDPTYDLIVQFCRSHNHAARVFVYNRE